MADGDKLLFAVGKRDDDLLVRSLITSYALSVRLDTDQFVEKHPRVSVASPFWHEPTLRLRQTR